MEKQNEPANKTTKMTILLHRIQGLSDMNRRLIFLALFVGMVSLFTIPGLVPSESMDPTLKVEDLVIYQKTDSVEIGDVVLFKYPYDKSRKYVKRVIADEGDRIEIQGSDVYVNGTVIEEPYIKEEWTGNMIEVVVPANHLFVMGDNRNNSEDSRFFGSISKADVVGKGTFVLFPLKRMGKSMH